jgi:integrase
MPKISKRVVDAAERPTNLDRTFVWDSEVKGFGLMVTDRGTKSYVVQYRTPENRSRRITIGRHGSPWTPEDARQRAIDMLRSARQGFDPLEAKAEARAALTVAELGDLYLSEGMTEKPNKKHSSWETDRSNIERHIKPLIGSKIAKSLTKADVSRFQADVASGKTARDERTGPRGRAIIEGGKGIAARSLAVLSAMLTFAVGRGLVLSNPAKGVHPYKGRPKERFLTDSEVAFIADALDTLERDAAIPPVASTAIKLLFLTGCRKGEILSLRWDYIDFDRHCFRLPDSKTGAKIVPIAAAALAILLGLSRTSTWVLPATKGQGHYVGLQKHWEAVKLKAGALALEASGRGDKPPANTPNFDNVRLHDLRHSFASFAVMDGAPLYLVGKLLGHKQSRTTEIYAHVADDPLRATAEIAARRIAKAMAPTSLSPEQKSIGLPEKKYVRHGRKKAPARGGPHRQRPGQGQIFRGRVRTGMN